MNEVIWQGSSSMHAERVEQKARDALVPEWDDSATFG